MAYNQFNAPRKPDIPRLTTEDILQVIYDMKYNQKIPDTKVLNWLMFDSGYNYGNTYAHQLLKDTNEYRKELLDGLNTHDLKDCLRELEAQKQDAKERNDNRLVFDIQKEINKVAGHYKERIEINGDMTFKVKWG